MVGVGQVTRACFMSLLLKGASGFVLLFLKWNVWYVGMLGEGNIKEPYCKLDEVHGNYFVYLPGSSAHYSFFFFSMIV